MIGRQLTGEVKQLDSLKQELLSEFRNYATRELASLEYSNRKSGAHKINAAIKSFREKKLKDLEDYQDSRLAQTLMISYVADLVMLEARNVIWPYEYMTFSRRIGEIWEPFCKIPFYYPIRKLNLFTPPSFNDVQEAFQGEALSFFKTLDVDLGEERRLEEYYMVAWDFVDSGSINLSLDLHFEQDGVFHNIDFKSGFSSNEKGNTNRLLQVASIYSQLGEEYKCSIFVRQQEDKNNHYLKTLMHSPFWDVSCAEDVYEKISEYTGFNLKLWMQQNMDWESDISEEFRRFLSDNDLIKYLNW